MSSAPGDHAHRVLSFRFGGTFEPRSWFTSLYPWEETRAMAKLNDSSDTSLKEEALDEEDEMDGWGPVRVRRSTIPAPPIQHAKADGADALSQSQSKEHDPKRLMT